MSAILSTTVRPAGTNNPGTRFRIFNAFWQRIARHFVCRAAIADLRELDDRALQDIGIAGCQIEAAVHGVVTVPNRGR